MRKRENRLVIVFVNLFVMLFLIGILVFNWNSSVPRNWPQLIMPFVFFIGLIHVFFIYTMRISIWDFRVVFILLSYLFLFGRVLLASMNLEYEASWWLQDYFTDDLMYKASLFSLCAVHSFFLGLFVIGKDKPVRPHNKHADYRTYNYSLCEDRRIFLTGMIIMVVALPCRIILDIRAIIASVATGWYEAAEGITGLWDDFSFWFIPAILCIIEGKPRKRVPILIVVLIYYVIVMALTGDRRYYVTALVSLLCYYMTIREEKRKIKPFWLILVGFLGVFFLNFLEVVRHSRYGGIGNLSFFISSYGSDIFDLSNVFVDVFSEFGISFYSVVQVIQYVPSLLPFQYGKTMLASVASLFPLGTSVITYNSSPSDFFNQYSGLYVGSTAIGDLYANFYLWAIPMIILLSYLLRKWFDFIERNQKWSVRLSRVLYYSSFYILLNLVRASIAEIVRPICWCVGIVLLVYGILNRKRV